MTETDQMRRRLEALTAIVRKAQVENEGAVTMTDGLYDLIDYLVEHHAEVVKALA